MDLTKPQPVDGGDALVWVERPTWPLPAATCRWRVRRESYREPRVWPARWRAGRPPERASGPFHPDQVRPRSARLTANWISEIISGKYYKVFDRRISQAR